MMTPFLSLVHLADTLAAEAPADNDTSTTILIAVLGSASIGAVLAAIVSGFFSKRKLGAEATEIITKAAAGVVTTLEGQITRLNTDREEMRTQHDRELKEVRDEMHDMAQAHAAERQEWKRVLQLHVAWDAVVLAKLVDLGADASDLPEAPPLLPANRYTDDLGYPR